jgi:hypothetical protein
MANLNLVDNVNDMSEAELLAMHAEFKRLQAENAALRAQPAKRMSMKVSEKGALSVYGLGRFPVTLYRGQWERLLGERDAITAFITANAATLSVKD